MKNLGSLSSIVSLYALTALTACNPTILTPTRASGTASRNTTAASVSFAEKKKKVFKQSCTQCHGTAFPHFDTFVEAKAALSAIEDSVFAKRSMPKTGGLSSDQSELLRKWIDEGGPEFADAAPVPTPPATQAATWASVRDGFVNVSCASCHYVGNPEGRVDLTDVKTFKASIGTIMYASLVEKEQPMPPVTSPPLTVEQKRILTEWVIANQPEQ